MIRASIFSEYVEIPDSLLYKSVMRMGVSSVSYLAKCIPDQGSGYI